MGALLMAATVSEDEHLQLAEVTWNWIGNEQGVLQRQAGVPVGNE